MYIKNNIQQQNQKLDYWLSIMQHLADIII